MRMCGWAGIDVDRRIASRFGSAHVCCKWGMWREVPLRLGIVQKRNTRNYLEFLCQDLTHCARSAAILLRCLSTVQSEHKAMCDMCDASLRSEGQKMVHARHPFSYWDSSTTGGQPGVRIADTSSSGMSRYGAWRSVANCWRSV